MGHRLLRLLIPTLAVAVAGVGLASASETASCLPPLRRTGRAAASFC